MGVSFTNIHAYNDKGYSNSRIIDTVQKHYTEHGYSCVSEKECPDICMYVFHSRDQRWVTFYQDTYEDLPYAELPECAREFAHMVKLPVLIGAVYDSEEAVIAYANDENDEDSTLIADSLPTTRGYFRYAAQSPFTKLVPLLRYAADKPKISKTWRSYFNTPEEKLAEFAALFGINSKLIGIGYRQYDETFRETPSFQLDGYTVTPLYFRKEQNKTIQEEKEPAFPILAVSSYDKIIWEKREYHISFINKSASGKGVSLFIFGAGISSVVEHNSFDNLVCSVKYMTKDGAYTTAEQSFSAVCFVDNTNGLCAKFENVELMKDEEIIFSFTLTRFSTDDSSVKIAAAPLENPKNGQIGVEVNCI